MKNDQLHHKRNLRQKREMRKNASKTKMPKILLLCEGTATEPKYFESLIRAKRLTSVELEGCGVTPRNILEKAKRALNKKDPVYNEIWCVFDRDNFPLENYNAAFEMANANDGIHIAYSNEAFELWYVLHFGCRITEMPRQDYKKVLTKYLGFEYKKNLENLYDLILDKQETAIKNAENLLSCSETPAMPQLCNPTTTVHLLVSRLNNLTGQ